MHRCQFKNGNEWQRQLTLLPTGSQNEADWQYVPATGPGLQYTSLPSASESESALPRPSMDAGSSQRYNCVCSNYNYGRPHPVSSATFHRHLNQARSEEEKQRIQDAKFDGIDRPNPRRSRGTATRRRDNRQAHEPQELRASVDRQQELPDVCISFLSITSSLINTPGPGWFICSSFAFPHVRPRFSPCVSDANG